MLAEQLRGLDAAALTPVIRVALNSATAEVGAWRQTALSGGWSAAGVYRLAGTARERGRDIPWSVILKAPRPSARDDRPDGASYWRREALLYASGLLDDLDGGLAAPRCLGLAERPDGAVWLWLEEVAEAVDPRWPPGRYALAARHLGAFQGGYLAGRDLPAAPWLGRGQLGQRLNRQPELMALLRDRRDEPQVRRYWPGDTVERALRLWAERGRFLAALEQLPPTFCHHDPFRRNLIARLASDGREETVAIDWEMAGPGPVGGDFAYLVYMSAQFFGLEVDQIPDLDGAAFEAYVAGLRAAGWSGDPRLARLGHAATAALAVGLSGAGIDLPDAARREQIEREVGRPYEAAVEHLARLRRLALDRPDEARRLMAAVGPG